MPQYDVDLYFSSFITFVVEAKDEDDAFAEAISQLESGLHADQAQELLINAQRWPDCDTVKEE